jgi:hypothetical protein
VLLQLQLVEEAEVVFSNLLVELVTQVVVAGLLVEALGGLMDLLE